MSAVLEINVQVNQAQEAAALAELSKIDGIIDKINKKGIDIKVNTSTANNLKNVATSAQQVATSAQTAAQTVKAASNLMKSSYKEVDGALKETSSTTQKAFGVMETATKRFGKAGETLTVRVVTDHEKIRKESAKTEAQWEKDTLKAIEYNTKAVDKMIANNARLVKDAEEASQKYKSAMERMTRDAVKEGNSYLAQQREEERKLAEEQAKADKARLVRLGKIGLSMAAAFAVKEIKEALSVMKEVDSELANIRKVTDESADAIARLGKQAYSTASKYGVSATDYLKNAADFAKAGYSNYGDIAELAIKTQLVGDVTAETASKFLLSADAAYKFQGNVESLTTVLDRANFIENNYATSIEKIADGFPIVASTASMANMSIDELVASLGTITAVTQETGRKAATALRALILNITGEIGEVLEDEQGEFEVTAESVESMSDALKKYGSEAIKAAKASGDLIDPIEAIRSLATAYRNGDLSRNELFSILTEIGGKLRTNQLAALIENFDMFEEMLAGVGTAAGSADRELGVMMDTWEAKTNQLKNSWTELVSNIADTKAIKNTVDGFRSLFDAINGLLTGQSAAESEAASKQKFEELWGENGTLTKELENLEAHYAVLTDYDKKRLDYLTQQRDAMSQQVAEAHELANKELLESLTENVSGTQTNRATLNRVDLTKKFYGVTGGDEVKSKAQLHNELQALLKEYEEYYDKIQALREDNVDITNKDVLGFEELYKSILKEVETLAKEAEEEAERLGTTLEEAGEDGSGGLKTITAEAKLASKALQEVADASREVKSANADAYRSQYQSFLTDWESGKTDTANVRNAIDLFVTPELQKEMGYNMQAIGEMLANELYQGIFNGAQENSAADFANYLYDNLGEELAGIAKITEEADGTLSFEYASAQKLATALKMPLSVVEALIDALDEYGVEAEMGWEDTEMLAQVLGLMGENAGTAEEQIRNAATALAQMGMQDPYEIQKVISQLGEAGYIDLSNIELPDLGKMISDAMAEVKASGKTELEITASVDGDESVSNLRADIDGIPNSKSSRVVARVSGANDVWGLVSALNNLRDVNVNVNANTNTSSSGSSTVVKPSQSNRIDQVAAEGTKNAKGGATLVNEVGPELISYNGRAYIANGGKPAIVSLGKGAVVLTAEETRNAIGYAKTQRLSLNGQISAAASGIPRSSGSTGLSGGYNAYVDKSSGEDKSEEEIVREEAKALETLAEYYHNMKQHSNEAAAYQEAINKLERIRAWYRANGLTETDTRVAEVANEIFGLQEKINDANSHAIDDLEEELDNLDAQITLAEHQGDAKRALELEKQAQDKIAELIKAYQDAGYSDTSDEILRLVNNGYNYADSSNSRLGDMRKEVIAAIKAMKETQDDANTLAEKQLAVEEARTAYENAQNQRTVRVFNPVTGQWEWVANAKDVADAEKALQSAEEALSQEQQSQELSALEEALENGSSLKDITIGPALAALISSASVNQTNALASALGVLSGGVAATADTSSKSIFDSVDSHDSVTNYTFNGVNIGQAIAETTTLAQLAKMISPLALTGNMPA